MTSDGMGSAATGNVVRLVGRKNLFLEGVKQVESFNDQLVLLDTEVGYLRVRGEGLHIRQLDLDKGSFLVEGVVNSLEYTGPGRATRKASRGALRNLFR